jgi:hypothetical protein
MKSISEMHIVILSGNEEWEIDQMGGNSITIVVNWVLNGLYFIFTFNTYTHGYLVQSKHL